MSPVRIFTRVDWEDRLRNDHGCMPATEYDEDFQHPKLETGEWWVTAGGGLFVVACDAQGILRQDDLQKAIVEITKLSQLDP